jgi:hypothetical protein
MNLQCLSQICYPVTVINSLTHCTQGKANTVAVLSVRELFKESNWIRWGSLNSILPILSEANKELALLPISAKVSAKPSRKFLECGNTLP